MIGKGKYSTVIATTAAVSANHGDTKTRPPMKARKNPVKVPSKVLARLKSNAFLERVPPAREAALSPKAKAAMAALLAGAGKSTKVKSMPKAK